MKKWYQYGWLCAKAGAIVFIALFLTLAGFEGYLRWKGFLEAQPAPYPCVTGDPVVNRRFLPNCRAELDGAAIKTDTRAVYETNSLGLRMPELRSGTDRVVLLGDSYTEGFGLSNHETLAARLAERWSARGLGNVEFVNGGILGTSPAVQRLFYERWLRPLKPKVVVHNLDFTDLWDDVHSSALADWDGSGPVAFPAREIIPSQILYWIYSNSSAVARLIHQEANLLSQHFRKAATIPLMERWVTTGEPLVDRGQLNDLGIGHCWKSYEYLARSIAGMARAARGGGANYVIHMYLPGYLVKKYAPGPDNLSFVSMWERVTAKDWSWMCSMDERSVKVFRAVALRLGVPFIETVGAVQARPDKESLYFERDAHWTAKGVQVIVGLLDEPLLKIWRSRR